MTALRDFLLSILGGSELLWDVALGVVIGGVVAGAVIGFVYMLLGFWAHSISTGEPASGSNLEDVEDILRSINGSLLDIKQDVGRRNSSARNDY